MAEERKYGVAANFDFPLVIFGSTNADFSSSVSFVAGDITLSKDGSTFVNINSTTIASQIGTKPYFTMSLDSTEMQMARGIILIVDQNSTKVFEDQSILIATYGSTAALHSFDRDSTSPNVNVSAMDAGVIGSTQLSANAITNAKIASGALTTDEIAAGVFTQVWSESTRTLTRPGYQLSSTMIATNAVTSTKIAPSAIGSTQIASGAFIEGKFASGALTTGVIAQGVFDKISSGVNVEVLDVLTVDSFGEPHTTTSAPPVSETLANKVGWMYGTFRNRFDASTSSKTFYTSTGGVAFTKSISDTGTYIEQAVTT